MSSLEGEEMGVVCCYGWQAKVLFLPQTEVEWTDAQFWAHQEMQTEIVTRSNGNALGN